MRRSAAGELAALFGPDALAEVPIAGTITLPQGGPRATYRIAVGKRHKVACHFPG